MIGLRDNAWASGETYTYRNFDNNEDTSQCVLMGWKWVQTDCSTPSCFICERSKLLTQEKGIVMGLLY